MTDLTPEIIEQALAALLDKRMVEPESVDYYIIGDRSAHEVIEAVLSAVAADLRAEGAAEAWDEGFGAGHEAARCVQPEYPDSPTNPYRKEADHG